MALAMYQSALLVEADSDGGVLGSRYGEWLDESAPGLSVLLAAVYAYEGLAAVDDQLPRLPGGARAVLIPPDAEGALGPVQRLVEDLADLRRALAGQTVVLDVGRVRPGSSSLMLAQQADALIAVVKPEIESLDCLMARLPVLIEQVPRFVVVVRGQGPYAVPDIRAALAQRARTRIAVIGVPDDARGVQALIRGRAGWSSWMGGGSASLRHSAGVLAMLLNKPAPEAAW